MQEIKKNNQTDCFFFSFFFSMYNFFLTGQLMQWLGTLPAKPENMDFHVDFIFFFCSGILPVTG